MTNITPDRSISGNKIAGGVITNFASTGIQDLATSTSLIVTNDAITVKAANIPFLNGNVRVNGNLDIAGSVTFEENIKHWWQLDCQHFDC
jgi:phage baseplate assembly protein gpV